ncbi:MAG: enoyl-CoA hydratase/isomerase family protein [Alphaproteobacteria bacterium]
MIDVLFDQKNHGGIITLNRPQALNSLSHAMILAIRNQLLKWREDPKIKFIILKSSDDRAFCAGGDLKELYALHQQKRITELEKFFKDEYELNKLIFNYPKPYISLIHGINMGGGMGVSIHGAFRIVSEKATLAMPEVHIGLFPDAAAAHFFCQCPGALGLFLSLTGYYMNSADALYAGIATHYVPRENFDLLAETLVNAPLSDDFREVVYEVIEMFSTGEPPVLSEVAQHRDLIEKVFSQGLDDVLTEMMLTKNSWLKNVGRKLAEASPFSLKITFKMIKESYGKSFEDIFQQDLKLAQYFSMKPDFYEGIRAALIDRDSNPAWQFSSVDEVPDVVVSKAFKG